MLVPCLQRLSRQCSLTHVTNYDDNFGVSDRFSGRFLKGVSVQDSEPRYQRIQRELERRILRCDYTVSTMLPTEAELSAEFTVSRFTIREALRKLTEGGYVARTQGRGTEVISSNPKRGYVQSLKTLDELFQIALETLFVLHDIQPVILTSELARRVGGKTGEEWFCITGVRWTEPGGKSICMIESYVPPQFAAFIHEIKDHTRPFFSHLEERGDAPIEQVVQEIRAVKMPQRVSRQLGLHPDALALQLLRRYMTKDGVLIASFNWHPAEQFAYTMTIDRSSAP